MSTLTRSRRAETARTGQVTTASRNGGGVVTAASAVILVAVVRRAQSAGVPWLRPGLWH